MNIAAWMLLAVVIAVAEFTGPSENTHMDWTVITVALIAALPGTMLAWTATRAARTAATKAETISVKQDETKDLVTTLQVQTDGHMKMLLAEAKENGRLAGMALERLVSAERAADVARVTAAVTAEVAALAQEAAESRVPAGNAPSGMVEQAAEVDVIRIEQAARIADAAEVVAQETKRLADATEKAAEESKT